MVKRPGKSGIPLLKKEGKIALIKSGSGLVLGTVELIDCIKLNRNSYLSNAKKLGFTNGDTCSYPGNPAYAWVLKDPKLYSRPKHYVHPKGAIIWVKLNE